MNLACNIHSTIPLSKSIPHLPGDNGLNGIPDFQGSLFCFCLCILHSQCFWYVQIPAFLCIAFFHYITPECNLKINEPYTTAFKKTTCTLLSRNDRNDIFSSSRDKSIKGFISLQIWIKRNPISSKPTVLQTLSINIFVGDQNIFRKFCTNINQTIRNSRVP